MSKKDFTKHLSLFTHPQVVQNRYDFIGMLVTKELTSTALGGRGGGKYGSQCYKQLFG